LKFAAIFVLLANAFSAGMMFLASVFISRYGGKELFGFFSVVLGVVVVGAKVSTLGLDVAIVRFLPEYNADKRSDAAIGIKRLAIGIAVTLSLAGAAVFASMLHLFRAFSWSVAIAAAASLPLAALLAVFQNIIRADGNVSRAVIGEAVVRPAGFIVCIVAIHFVWFPGIGNFWIGFSYSLALALALAVVVMIVIYENKVNWAGAFKLGSKQLREWLSHGLSLLLSESATALLNQAPILLAGLLLSAAEAGEMSAIIRLAMLVIFALTAVQSIITPFLSKAMVKGNQAELQALVARASAFTMMVAVPVCWGFIAFAPQLLGIFGDEYGEAVPLLRIMLVAYFVYAAAGPTVALMTMTGQHKVARQVICWAAVVMMVGGASAMVLGGLAMSVWVAAGVIAVYPHVLAHFCRKRLAVDPTVLSLRLIIR
jgi:O-antigen/teichoic acid export membrane protein